MKKSIPPLTTLYATAQEFDVISFSTAPWISVGFAVTVMVGFVGTRSKLTHGWQSKDPQPAKESRKQHDESTD